MTPPTPPTKHTARLPLIAGAAALVAFLAAVILLGVAPHADGARVLPLDDSYIHMQYGWQAAHGTFLTYNDGEAPSSGATSLLYQVLIAGGGAAGLSKAAMPGVLAWAGALCYAGAAALNALTAARLAEHAGYDDRYIEAAGLLGGTLIALNGWLAWHAVSGMETALLLTAISGVLWAVVTGRSWAVAAFGVVATLTRPETAILALLLPLACLLLYDEDSPRSRRDLLLWSLPLLAAFVSPLVNRMVTGSASASGFSAKAWLTLQPFSLTNVITQTWRAAWEVGFRVFGGLAAPGYGTVHTPLALNLLAVIGAILLWRSGRAGNRRLMLIALGWALLGIGATASLQTYGWHRYRYQVPLYPAMVGPAVLAVLGGLRAIEDRPAVFRRGFAMLVAGSLGLFGLLSIITMRAAYQLDSETTLAHQVAMAGWLRANTAEDAVIGVHDVGVLRYFGDRTTFDAVGLTSAGMAEVNRNGPGATYEAFSEVRPDYLAVYPEGGPPFWGVSAVPDLLGEVLFTVEKNPFGVASAHATQVISRPDWTLNDAADEPGMPSSLAAVDGLARVDAVNIASLPDEAAHDYEWWVTSAFRGLISEPFLYSYREDPSVRLADGARALNGGERFTVSAEPGEDLTLIGRFHQEVELALIVSVDGTDAGRWLLPAVPGEWLESRFVIPGELIKADDVTIALHVETPGAEAVYRPAYYWVYSGSVTYPAFDTDSAVTFGDGLHLIEVEVPEGMLQAGGTLPVMLTWGVSTPPELRTLRVFVHLVDVNDPDTLAGLMAQADGEPGRGAHPFWTWTPGEVGVETMALALPADLPTGTYDLLIGVYDPISGSRLPVSNGVDRGANRHYVMSFEAQ